MVGLKASERSNIMQTTKRELFTVREAKEVGDKLGIDWEQIDIKQFHQGMNAELEDGAYNPVTSFASDDPILVGKIVRAHLSESANYYIDWAQMEKKVEREYSNKSSLGQGDESAKAE